MEVFRESAIPFSEVLGAGQMRELLEHDYKVRRLEEEARKSLSAAVDQLHGAIALEQNPKERAKLLKHKRSAKLNLNWVKKGQAMSTIMSPVLQDSIRCLGERIIQWEQARARSSEVFSAEKERTKRELLELAARPNIARGISYSAPGLYEKLRIGNYQVQHDLPIQIEDKALSHVFDFLFRAALKTTPISTFTIIVVEAEAMSSDPKIYPTLDGRLVSSIEGYVLNCPNVWPALSFRINSTFTVLEARAEFITPPPRSAVIRISDRRVLELAARMGQKTWSFYQMSTVLNDVFGQGDLNILRYLIETGIIECVAPFDRLAPGIISRISSFVENALLSGEDTEAEHGVSLVAQDFEKICARDIEESAVLSEALKGLSQLESAQNVPTELEMVEPPSADECNRVRNLLSSAGLETEHIVGHDHLVHEILLKRNSRVNHSTGASGSATSELRELLSEINEWLSVFEPNAPTRLGLADYCEKEFGWNFEMPIVSFYSELMKRKDSDRDEVLTRWLGNNPVELDFVEEKDLTTRLRQLKTARERAMALVDEHKTSGGKLECKIRRHQIVSQLGERPKSVINGSPSTTYWQKTGEGQVINSVHIGYRRGVDRLTSLLDSYECRTSKDEFPANWTQRTVATDLNPLTTKPTGKIEMLTWGAAFGSSLNWANRHPEQLIRFPGYESEPLEGAVELRDIGVRFSNEDGLLELFKVSTGKAVRIEHLGMMANFQLPPLANFIERVFARPHLFHPSKGPFHPLIDLANNRDAIFVPRITIEGVTIQRRRSIIPRAELGSPPADEYQYWLWLRETLSRLELQSRSFVRSWAYPPSKGNTKARKPFFLDADSWWSVREFRRRTKNATYLVFDECLPDFSEPASGQVLREFVTESDGWRGINDNTTV